MAILYLYCGHICWFEGGDITEGHGIKFEALSLIIIVLYASGIRGIHIF